MAIVLPLPDAAVLVGLLVMLTFVALASFWAPGMALLSDAAEDAGLDQALAFAISNLAWAAGPSSARALGGAVADASSDAVPTRRSPSHARHFAVLTASRRRHEALSA